MLSNNKTLVGDVVAFSFPNIVYKKILTQKGQTLNTLTII